MSWLSAGADFRRLKPLIRLSVEPNRLLGGGYLERTGSDVSVLRLEERDTELSLSDFRHGLVGFPQQSFNSVHWPPGPFCDHHYRVSWSQSGISHRQDGFLRNRPGGHNRSGTSGVMTARTCRRHSLLRVSWSQSGIPHSHDGIFGNSPGGHDRFDSPGVMAAGTGGRDRIHPRRHCQILFHTAGARRRDLTAR